MPTLDALKPRTRFARVWIAIGVVALGMPLRAQAGEHGFHPIFDGKTLQNWDGNPKFWSVEDGAITGQTTQDNPTKGNTFLVWRGGTVKDFELKLEYKIRNHNSGIQYRSFEVPKKKWVIGGYQADIDSKGNWVGTLYGEKFRGVLAKRGQKTVLKRSDGKFQREVVGSVGDPKKLLQQIDLDGWNEYHIIARGNHFVHKINGQGMMECTDQDSQQRRSEGLIALQLHAGPPMKVQFRNIRLKKLGNQTAQIQKNEKTGRVNVRLNDPNVSVFLNGQRLQISVGRELFNLDLDIGEHKLEIRQGDRVLQAEKLDVQSDQEASLQVALGSAGDAAKEVIFIAGRKSHGYGSHEHKAGCMLLAEALNESGLPVRARVITGGWPDDDDVLDDADAVVCYADGGGGHPFVRHLDEVEDLMEDGIGLACLHYAVEVPKGEAGNAFRDWIGGYFETHWSVNPHWTAQFEKLPKHAVTRGVEPFTIRDEWYYHMRFRDKLQGVKPLLTDLPPEKTLNRPDGAHSNNPHVREAVLKRKEPQHVAWVAERPDGGRGFGFTGGHFHWNWGHDEFRQIVLNAILWVAGGEVPQDGVPSQTPTVKELMANQDYDPPKNFNPKSIAKKLKQWNATE